LANPLKCAHVDDLITADTLSPDPAIKAPPHFSDATGSQAREGPPRSASPASSISHLSPTTQTRFDLPNLPTARQSASSLMDAIFGGPAPPGPSAGHDAPAASRPSPAGPTQPSISPIRAAPPPAPSVQFKRKPKKSVSRTPSSRSQQSNADTESWDVLSDADSRLNEGGGQGERDEVVAELQKKVDRR
jgi:hypothetical protein